MTVYCLSILYRTRVLQMERGECSLLYDTVCIICKLPYNNVYFILFIIFIRRTTIFIKCGCRLYLHVLYYSINMWFCDTQRKRYGIIADCRRQALVARIFLMGVFLFYISLSGLYTLSIIFINLHISNIK